MKLPAIFRRKSFEVEPSSSQIAISARIQPRKDLAIRAKLADHLTSAAHLRNELAIEDEVRAEQYVKRSMLESEQVAASEAEEQYSKVRRLVHVFSELGIPCIDVEVLDEVKPSSIRLFRPKTISIEEYTGKGYENRLSERFRVVDRMKGWLLPPMKVLKSSDREDYSHSDHYNLYDEHAKTFSGLVPLLITESGGNWSQLLTPRGVTDSSIKGVVVRHGDAFQRSYISHTSLPEVHQGSYFKEDRRVLAHFIGKMTEMAQAYGYDPTAETAEPPVDFPVLPPELRDLR